MLHKFRHRDRVEKAYSVLKLSGFQQLKPFQKQVLPAIYSGKNLIVETKQAADIEITFLLPLFAEHHQKKESPSTIILTDSYTSVLKIENIHRLLERNTKVKVSLAALKDEGNPANDLPLLNKKPCIIVGTTRRIIDHIRRNNILLTNTNTLIIDVPDKTNQIGFEQNVLFIYSKLSRKTQIQIFISSIDQLTDLENLLKHPQLLMFTDREKFDNIAKGDSSVDKEKLELRIQTIIEDIKSNPDDLIEYRKIFKKKVPIFLRSYFAARLLMETEGSPVKTGRRQLSGNMKTLFVSIGRRRKVHPRDLIKLFQNTMEIQTTSIGPIKVLDNYSFVDIDEKLSDKAVEKMNGMDFRGRKISVDFAKKKP
jgi:hypothetical protein